MEIKLKRDRDYESAVIGDNHAVKVLLPNNKETNLSEDQLIREALKNPINSKMLSSMVKSGEKVAVVTSDITRPLKSWVVLPYVLEELEKGGVKNEDVTIVLALGSHRKHTDEEKIHLVGEEVFRKYKVIDSDMDDCMNIGTCRNNTPVDIFTPVAQTDRVVCLGNVEFHYFAGYSGGAKALMPGVSSHAAIQANHSNMVKEGAHAGNLDTNPVRQDIDEVGQHIKIDFILNVLQSFDKTIVGAFAGHYIDAHRAACRALDEMYKVSISERADVVIVSPGGYPKDINIYQAQKALDNARHAVKDGGIIILCASCREGFENKVFEEWMMTKTKEQMVRDIREHFVLGGHKAAAIAMTLMKADIYMVTDYDKATVEHMGFRHFTNLQEAVDEAERVTGINSRVIVMPAGGSTLPCCE
ncbi:MAG: nickel-dependent lactate racemase [Sedimentibacter sp.]|uniref:nickel-dependent lactate racemase n=1 Tax=Sedimentibacter sp. TaxID=1960295 RepID=UPI003158E48D